VTKHDWLADDLFPYTFSAVVSVAVVWALVNGTASQLRFAICYRELSACERWAVPEAFLQKRPRRLALGDTAK